MIVELSILDTPTFTIEHLLDSSENPDLVNNFSVGNEASGLELYLKNQAAFDEKEKLCRTYLVKDKATHELAGYFSLRTGLITLQVYENSFDSIPAIELANFAMNANYRKKHPEVTKLGFYIFRSFILPLANAMSSYIGVNSLYIYSLPIEKLIKHYKTMGFSRLPKEQEKFVQNHVKPKYDEGCIFMYQNL